MLPAIHSALCVYALVVDDGTVMLLAGAALCGMMAAAIALLVARHRRRRTIPVKAAALGQNNTEPTSMEGRTVANARAEECYTRNALTILELSGPGSRECEMPGGTGCEVVGYREWFRLIDSAVKTQRQIERIKVPSKGQERVLILAGKTTTGPV